MTAREKEMVKSGLLIKEVDGTLSVNNHIPSDVYQKTLDEIDKKLEKLKNIRPANENDVEGIAKLLFQVQAVHAEGRPDIFKAGERKYNDDEILQIIRNPEAPIFVYDNGGILGYVFCIIKETKGKPQLVDRKTLFVDDLCIEKSARSMGIGQALMTYCEDFAESIGCSSITLCVWELNSKARSFYDKFGFQPLETVMEKKL